MITRNKDFFPEMLLSQTMVSPTRQNHQSQKNVLFTNYVQQNCYGNTSVYCMPKHVCHISTDL